MMPPVDYRLAITAANRHFSEAVRGGAGGLAGLYVAPFLLVVLRPTSLARIDAPGEPAPHGGCAE